MLSMPGSPAQADRYLAAIKRLKANGEAITVRAVRDEAGGGSMNTVNAVVREWREKKRKATQKGVVTRMLDTAVRDELERRRKPPPPEPPPAPKDLPWKLVECGRLARDLGVDQISELSLAIGEAHLLASEWVNNETDGPHHKEARERRKREAKYRAQRTAAWMDELLGTDPKRIGRAILGFGRKASDGDVKRLFRKLSRRTHPDHGGDPEVFAILKRCFDLARRP